MADNATTGTARETSAFSTWTAETFVTRRPFPAEGFPLMPKLCTKEEIAAFRERYNIAALPAPLRELLE